MSLNHFIISYSSEMFLKSLVRVAGVGGAVSAATIFRNIKQCEEGLDEMNIHWYHPKRWTLGLVTRYIRWKYARQIFSARFSDDKNLTKSENAYKIAAG